MARYVLFILCLLSFGCASGPLAPVSISRAPRVVIIRHIPRLDANEMRYTSRVITLKFQLDEAIRLHADEIRTFNDSIASMHQPLHADCAAARLALSARMHDVVSLDIQAEYLAYLANISAHHYLVTGEGEVPEAFIVAYNQLQAKLDHARSLVTHARAEMESCLFQDPAPIAPSVTSAQALSFQDASL
jgi:hypothetical protein